MPIPVDIDNFMAKCVRNTLFSYKIIGYISWLPREIGNIVNLKVIVIEEQLIDDISALKNCAHLEYLALASNNIRNISPLRKCTMLKVLDLSNNYITNITALRGCTELECLKLESNSIKNISPIQNCTQLKCLYISDNYIKNIRTLKRLKNLKYISIDDEHLICFLNFYVPIIVIDGKYIEDAETLQKYTLSQINIATRNTVENLHIYRRRRFYLTLNL